MIYSTRVKFFPMPKLDSIIDTEVQKVNTKGRLATTGHLTSFDRYRVYARRMPGF